LKAMEVGVFLSSLNVGDVLACLEKAGEMGFKVAQLPPLAAEWRNGPKTQGLIDAVKGSGIEIFSICAGYEGESYADIETVRRTVGLLPISKRPERIVATKEHADIAAAVGAKMVTTHVGVVPSDATTAEYKGLVAATAEVAADCARKGLLLGLETGQEPPEEMLVFMEAVAAENLRINFDPANMILYGSGEPIAALEMLKEHVAGVHVKDGLPPTEPGKLGTEVPLGEGNVGMERYIAHLKAMNYGGPLIIEREAGEDRVGDIARGKELLERLRG
jgi:sugar phosphate isomerase/epimerase